MRIRGRRLAAAVPPPIFPPQEWSGYPPPSSPLKGPPPGPFDARRDESPTAARGRIEPSSPRSSSPGTPPTPCPRFCQECEGAGRCAKGKYAQLSEILKERPGRRYRREKKPRGFLSNAEAKAKLESKSDKSGLPDDRLNVLIRAVGLLDSPSDECKVESCSFTGDGPEAADESKATPAESKQGSTTKSSRGRGKRSTSWGVDMHQFGLQKSTRVNNYHWTPDEVNQLVEGISALGVGRWTELKSTYFPTSIRTAQHLKDKWRNLLIGCGLQIGKKRKVEVPKVTGNLKDRIIELHERHWAIKRRRTSSEEEEI